MGVEGAEIITFLIILSKEKFSLSDLNLFEEFSSAAHCNLNQIGAIPPQSIL